MSDPYSANTVLLLHMEGSNGSTTFTDSSGIPKTVARYGDTQISTAQSKWGNGSGYFDGNGDYLSLADSEDWAFGSGDFTVEVFIKSAGVNQYAQIMGQRNNAGQSTADCPFGLVRNNTANTILATIWNGSNNSLITGSATVFNDNWHHLALVRNGTTISLYVDGQSDGTPLTGVSYAMANSTKLFSVGRAGEYDGQYFAGYLQDLRITKGVARYTDNFTPPAARLPDPDPITGLILPSGYRHDLYDGGTYRITGNVDELGVAGSYRVRLFDRQSGRCIRETWSAADGFYAFNSIAYRPNGYFAIAFDHGDNPLNAAIADLITPEPMP